MFFDTRNLYNKEFSMKLKNQKHRLIALLLLAATLLPSFAACSPKDDGNDDEQGGQIIMDENYYITMESEGVDIVQVFDFGSPIMMSYNSQYSNKVNKTIVYSGEDYNDTASLHITGNDGGLKIVQPLETCWADYTTLKFAIYSEKATFTNCQLRFSNPPNGKTMDPYIRYVIDVDWTGWKEFSINIDEMPGNYDPTLDEIVSMSLDTSGWDLTCSPDTSLYLGGIYLAAEEFYINSEIDLDDPEIYDKVKEQWRELLIGDTNEKAKHSETYVSSVSSVSSQAKSTWELYQSKGGTFGYSITNATTHMNGDEQKIGSVYGNILKMAKGYATVGTDMYKNKLLLRDIKNALKFAYENYYGTNVLNNQTYGNWWWWDIGTPMNLVNILLIMEKDLDSADIAKYLEPFDHRNMYPSMTACNKVWITYSCLASAFLQQDAERILISKHYMNDVFNYVYSGDGFYTDGSFIQHGKHPYTGGYGLSMMVTLSDIMMALRGSRFDIIDDNANNQYTWIFENFSPVNYGGNFFASARGREVDRNTSEKSANNSIVTVMIKMTTYAPEDVRPQLLSLIRYNMLARNTDYSGGVPLNLVDFAVELKTNENVTPEGYDGVKVFGKMDRVAQHGTEYGVCVALNSTRIYKYEAINSENMDAWYHSDGMIYIYTDDYDYNYSFYNYVNPYRMPGTTVNTVERKAENISSPILGNSPFVGGVEAGKYGMAVFELGYADNKHYTSDIHANKTYFLFDNEIVAVGSGIKDTSGTDVVTVIENRIWRDNDVFTVNGVKESLAAAGRETNTTAKYMHFTNMGGYVFFEDTDVTLSKAMSGSTFLEIWTSHGKNPKDAKYAYIYLPEATAEETQAYSSSLDVEILTQTDSIHVVRENTKNVTGYAFYKSGTANGVTVSDRCALMITEEDGEYTINISDPTHLKEKLELTLDIPASSIVSSCDEAAVKFEGGKVVITLNISENVGQTFTVSVK